MSSTLTASAAAADLARRAPLYAVAAGDLVADAPGIEVAVGGESKAVTVLSRYHARK
jgi:hypothetical protein